MDTGGDSSTRISVAGSRSARDSTDMQRPAIIQVKCSRGDTIAVLIYASLHIGISSGSARNICCQSISQDRDCTIVVQIDVRITQARANACTSADLGNHASRYSVYCRGLGGGASLRDTESEVVANVADCQNGIDVNLRGNLPNARHNLGKYRGRNTDCECRYSECQYPPRIADHRISPCGRSANERSSKTPEKTRH